MLLGKQEFAVFVVEAVVFCRNPISQSEWENLTLTLVINDLNKLINEEK